MDGASFMYLKACTARFVLHYSKNLYFTKLARTLEARRDTIRKDVSIAIITSRSRTRVQRTSSRSLAKAFGELRLRHPVAPAELRLEVVLQGAKGQHPTSHLSNVAALP